MSFCQSSLRVTPDGLLHLTRPVAAHHPAQWSLPDEMGHIVLGATDGSPLLSLSMANGAAEALFVARSDEDPSANVAIDSLGCLVLGDLGTANAADAALFVRTEDALAPPPAKEVALRITSDTYANAVTVDWRGHIQAASGISSFLGRANVVPGALSVLHDLAPGEVVQATARCSEGTFTMAKVLYPEEGEPLAILEEGFRTRVIPPLLFQDGGRGALVLTHEGDQPRNVDWSVLVLLPGAILPGGHYIPLTEPVSGNDQEL